MYILHLDLGYELRGGQRQLAYLSEYLQEHGEFTPVVAAPKKAPLLQQLKKQGIITIPLLNRNIFNPINVLRLSLANRQYNFRAIHSHEAKAATFAALCHRLWLKSGFPKLIHTRRVSYPLHSGLRLKKYLRADAVVAVSQEIADIIRQSGIAADKIFVIHSGIDPSLYAKKQKKQDNRFIFCSIGALTAQKGYDVLIKALTELKKVQDVPDWELRIIGQGGLFNDILTLAEKEQVLDKIAMLGSQDSKKMLPLADALIIASTVGEGSNAVIKEAWATEIPVICSNLPSNLELVKNFVNGLVFTNKNSLDLAAGMKKLMHDEQLRLNLVDHGKQSLREFTAQVMSDKYIALYKALDLS